MKTDNLDIALSCITLFYTLLSDDPSNIELKKLIFLPDTIKKIHFYKQEASDLRIRNISTIFIEDFATRFETVA